MKSPSSLQVESHVVFGLAEAMRLSDYAGGKFKAIASRKGMKKAIDKGWVNLNGALASTGSFLKNGDILELKIEDRHLPPVLELKVELLYEDEHLAVVYKPAGIEVSGSKNRVLENALPFNLSISQEPDALARPQAIHRLDFPTTGALLIGKTRSIVTKLNQLFELGKINKSYASVCIGHMKMQGEIEAPIDGKNCHSSWKVLQTVSSERFGQLNLVSLIPHTGRRHQLRKHMASVGNPILGDRDYGNEGLILKGKGLYLHANTLSFIHPITNERLIVRAALPSKFSKIFDC